MREVASGAPVTTGAEAARVDELWQHSSYRSDHALYAGQRPVLNVERQSDSTGIDPEDFRNFP